MSRPLDRTCELPELGAVDRAAGEFWVANPFMMPSKGENLSAYERNRIFFNRQGTGFVDGSRFSDVDIDSDSRSVVSADFDRDGKNDLLVGNVGGGPLRLFLNRLPSDNRHVVRLQLIGKSSNRPAIGARVIAHCGDQQIVRDLFAPNGCMGQGPPELLLGVGAAAAIDRLEIRWPNGNTQTLTGLPVDATLRIIESQNEYETLPLAVPTAPEAIATAPQ